MSDLALSAAEQAQFDGMRQADQADQPDPAAGQSSQAPDTIEPIAPGAETSLAEQEANEQQPPRQQTVPHGAFHEERERRKAAEQQLAEMRRERQILEERTNIILQRLNQPPAPPEQPQPLPALNDDPLGHLVGTIDRQQREIAQLSQVAQQTTAQQQQAQLIAQVQMHAAAAEQQFRQAAPDYDAAAQHLLAQRDSELEDAGFGDPVQRQALLQQEALGIAVRAIQQGRNPAEMIYELAKLRGYQKAEAQPAAQQQPSAAERLQQINAGQQQSRSVGAMRGSAPPSLTSQRVLEMSDKQFAEFLAKADQEQLETVLGA